jgi:cardiolipin synthase
MTFRWLRTGQEAYAASLEAVDAATRTIRCEVYIFESGEPGTSVRDALTRASARGVQVRVLLDAFGSLTLSDNYWEPLRQAGGEMRWFNPLSLQRFNIRDHRKLLVVDETVALVGGFNVAPMWRGDGLTSGWRDVGLRLTGPLADELAQSFDSMFSLADFRHRRFPRWRRSAARRHIPAAGGQLLLSGPGRGRSPIRRALQHDLARSSRVHIIAAYFLPPPRLRRAISRAARRGAQVQLILPGKSDIPLMQAASRSLYQRLLRAGVEIYEYAPQILHTKFVLLSDGVYVGSANLDVRSLSINYELLLRLTEPSVLSEAEAIFQEHLAHSQPIDRRTWRQARTVWSKIKERWASFLFTRIDPYVTRWQLEGWR